VQDEILARLREDKARASADAAAQALAARINAGESLATVAATVGAQPAATQSVTRRGPTAPDAAPMVPELVKAAFLAPRPATGKASAGVATLASGDSAVFVVQAVQPGTLAALGPDPGEFTRAYSGQKASLEIESYVGELRRNAKIKRNPQLWAAP